MPKTNPKQKKVKEICGNCKHYRYCECHRNPPQVFVFPDRGGYTWWPSVNLDDFCGEFKPKSN